MNKILTLKSILFALETVSTKTNSFKFENCSLMGK